MARRRRSNGASKHNDLILKQNDLILKPKSVIKNRPVDWAEDDEGELQPIFAPEPLFTCEELEPYRSNRALFDHKRSLRKLVGPPFPFLKLPTELRVEIYRYCLVAYKPIQPYGEHLSDMVFFSSNRSTRLAFSLLRTCKAMHDECAEVLYGENEFRFAGKYQHLELLKFLTHIGPHHRMWLRNLTMNSPFVGSGDRIIEYELKLEVDSMQVDSEDSYNWYINYQMINPQSPPLSEAQRREMTWAELCKPLFNLLESLPRLRVLAIVFPHDWEYCNDAGDYVPWPHTMDSRGREEIWKYLLGLLRVKPFVQVRVVRPMVEAHMNDPEFAEEHQNRERHLANLKRRLGIWDHRVVFYDRRWEWRMPDQVEEDPDDSLCDVRGLFAE
ncbi:hypothetical protein J4E81_006485 [Alternaria sp. BMP 2799]|nr:hypothetical protein J4E81_006485 [Alternaria sp. BMP 2799]